MKWIFRLWYLILLIVVLWCYFLWISPRIFSSETVLMPDVIGFSEEQTVQLLKDRHLKYQITYMQNDEEVTLKTVPSAEIKIKKDDVIQLYIGKVFPATYHSYLGQKYEDVEQAIEQLCEEHGIRLQLLYEQKDDVIGGLIVEESLSDGDILREKDFLTLTISVNDSYFSMPNLVGMNILEALRVLESYQIEAKINYYSAPMPEDTVLFQSIAKDTIIRKNNPYQMTLYVSKGLNLSTVSDPYELEELLVFLGYEVEVFPVISNEIPNKLVAFQVQKLYDNNKLKYILWITE